MSYLKKGGTKMEVATEKKEFLGYHIGDGDMSIPFKEGYDDKMAIARAVNLAQSYHGIVLNKWFQTETGKVKERLFPEEKKAVKPKCKELIHKRTLR